MQILQLETAEVDYCLFCGGAFFDRGEIESVLEQPLPVTESGRPSERRCARCQSGMSSGNLGTVPVDQCTRCAGLYLDTHELAPASRRTLQEGTRESMAMRSYTTACVGCQKIFSPDLLTATGQGLACGLCYGALDFGTLYPQSRLTHFGTTAGLGSLLDDTEPTTASSAVVGLLHLLSLFGR